MGASSSIVSSEKIRGLTCKQIGKIIAEVKDLQIYIPLFESRNVDGQMLSTISDNSMLIEFFRNIGIESTVDIDLLTGLFSQFLFSVETQSKESMTSIPLLGIKASYLQQILVSFGGESALARMTSSEIAQRLIAPKLERSSQSFCDHLSVVDSTTTGPATAYVCYNREIPFLGVLSALLADIASDQDAVLWIDVFCLPVPSAIAAAFIPAPAPTERLQLQMHRDIVSKLPTMVIALGWSEMASACLQSSWCMWELSSALKNERRLTIALTPVERSQMLKDIRSDINKVLDAISLMTVEQSRAQPETARVCLINEIVSEYGVKPLDDRLYVLLRDWVTSLCESAIASEVQPLTKAKLELSLGRIFQASAKYEDARPLFQSSLEAFRSKLGSCHVDVMNALYDCALFYKNSGDMDTSESLYIECLHNRRTMLGDDHKDTINTMNALSLLLSSRGKFAEAEPVCQLSWETLKAKYGPSQPETLVAMNNFAMVLKEQKKYGPAAGLLKHCWELRASVLGDNSPETLASMSSFAGALMKLKKYDDAEAVYVSCIPLMQATLGETHHRTLHCENHLASLRKLRLQKTKGNVGASGKKKPDSVTRVKTAVVEDVHGVEEEEA